MRQLLLPGQQGQCMTHQHDRGTDWLATPAHRMLGLAGGAVPTYPLARLAGRSGQPFVHPSRFCGLQRQLYQLLQAGYATASGLAASLRWPAGSARTSVQPAGLICVLPLLG
jgi:hypothetical protein